MKINPIYEKLDYNYSMANVARRLTDPSRRAAVDAFKAESMGITLKEALTSAELTGYIPDLYTDEITALGLREAWARVFFPVVPQSSHGAFKQRYMSRSDGAQVLGELEEIKHSGMERDVEEFEFNKLADWPWASWELLMDSPLAESAMQLQLAMSKIWRRENQLMTHMLSWFSKGDKADEWNNHVEGPDSSSSPADMMDAIQRAFLNMTVRLTDRVDPSEITILLTPTYYTTLFNDDSFRRYDILGGQPNFLTGQLPSIYRMPQQIIESGYFAQGTPSSTFIPQEFDIYLVARRSAAIRERVSLRTEPIVEERFQGAGPILWERLTPYVTQPFAYRRISPTRDYANIIANKNIRIRPKLED